MEGCRRVAAVIVNFNGIEHIGGCLESLRGQTFRDLLIVVVDNSSTDGSAELIERDFPEVDLVRSPVNLGFAAGNNLAIEGLLRASLADYILTLNNDVLLDSRCLEALVGRMDHAPRAFSCQPKMYLSRGPGVPRMLNNAGILVWRDGSAFNRGMNEPDEGQYDGSPEIFGTCAGCSLYRASGMRETGLFDEEFFAYMEDVDLAWRARRLGYTSMLCDSAVCYHRHGASATDPALKIALLEGNRVRVLLKNYTSRDILVSPLFTAYRMTRLAMLGLFHRSRSGGSRLDAYRGELTAGAAVGAAAKGWLDGLRSAPVSLRKRRSIKCESALSESEVRGLLRRFSAPLGGLVSR